MFCFECHVQFWRKTKAGVHFNMYIMKLAETCCWWIGIQKGNHFYWWLQWAILQVWVQDIQENCLMLLSPVLWRFLCVWRALSPQNSCMPVRWWSVPLKWNYWLVSILACYDLSPLVALPVTWILLLHRIQKLGVEQLSCFSSDTKEKMETD